MSMENWLDKIAKLMAVDDGRKGTVRSYAAFEKDEFPEAITEWPCAISYVVTYRAEYSAGGPLIDLYTGVTEFHLCPNVAKSNIPYILRFFARIRNAAAGSMTLGGAVDSFLLRKDTESIQGPVRLTYGSEDPHHGLIVNWFVKDVVNGEFTPAA